MGTLVKNNVSRFQWNLKYTSTFSLSTGEPVLVPAFFSIFIIAKYWKHLVLPLSVSRFNHSFNFIQMSFWWSQRAPIKICILSCFWTIDLKIYNRLVIIKINDNLLFFTKFYQGIYSPSHVNMDLTQTHGSLFFWCWSNIKWF